MLMKCTEKKRRKMLEDVMLLSVNWEMNLFLYLIRYFVADNTEVEEQLTRVQPIHAKKK